MKQKSVVRIVSIVPDLRPKHKNTHCTYLKTFIDEILQHWGQSLPTKTKNDTPAAFHTVGWMKNVWQDSKIVRPIVRAGGNFGTSVDDTAGAF